MPTIFLWHTLIFVLSSACLCSSQSTRTGAQRGWTQGARAPEKTRARAFGQRACRARETGAGVWAAAARKGDPRQKEQDAGAGEASAGDGETRAGASEWTGAAAVGKERAGTSRMGATADLWGVKAIISSTLFIINPSFFKLIYFSLKKWCNLPKKAPLGLLTLLYCKVK